MTDTTATRHPAIYMLGDNLDAALATGEDLLAERVDLADAGQKLDMARLTRQSGEVAAFVETVRVLELGLIARVLQARRRADELKRKEALLRPLIGLFTSGTTALVDAADEMGDTTAQAFETGDASQAFMRSRGLIERDTAGLEPLSHLAVTDEFLVAGRIRLGTLLDLTSTFLDTLDNLFDLYAEEPAETADVRVPKDVEAQGVTEPLGAN